MVRALLEGAVAGMTDAGRARARASSDLARGGRRGDRIGVAGDRGDQVEARLAGSTAPAAFADVLHQLGRAEAAAALAAALEHLERAYAHARSSAQRGLIPEDLALCLLSGGARTSDPAPES